MMMIVAMVVVMVVIVAVVVMVMVMVICRLKTAHARAEGITERTIGHIGPWRIGTLPFDMVMMAFLHGTHFAFKPQHGCAIFAQHAGRRRDRTKGRMGAICCADMVVLALLKRQNLTAIAANTAIGRWCVADLFHDPFGKCFQHLGVIAQIAGLDELDIRVFSRNLIGKTVNPVNQDA